MLRLRLSLFAISLAIAIWVVLRSAQTDFPLGVVGGVVLAAAVIDQIIATWRRDRKPKV